MGIFAMIGYDINEYSGSPNYLYVHIYHNLYLQQDILLCGSCKYHDPRSNNTGIFVCVVEDQYIGNECWCSLVRRTIFILIF